jgi:O-antigen ligase
MMIIFYILIISLPYVDHGLFGREIAGLTLEKIIGAVCFVYALAYLPRRNTLPTLFASGQAKAFGLYVALALTSYVVTAEAITFADFVGIFLSQFLFFITVMVLVDSRERLQNVILVLIASIGFVSLYLIREWIGNMPTYGFAYRPGWVAGDPNMFSASALIVLPLMLHPKTIAPRIWQRVGVITCLVLTGFAFLLAASRGGFLGLVCMYLWQLRTARRRIVALGVCLMILLICLASPYSPLDRILKPTASDVESSNIRLQLWSVSEKILADHPIFGVGLWNFPKYMHRYLPPGVDLDFVVPHNTFLEAAVELGLTGLAMFLAVLALSMYSLTKMYRAAIAIGDAYFASLTNALSSGLVGFAVAAFFLSAKHAKLFWFAMFLSACLPPLIAQAVRAKRSEDEADKELAAPAIEESASLVPATIEHIPIRVGNWLTRH